MPALQQQDQHHAGTQVTPVPGGTLVQGPQGQEYIPNGAQGLVQQGHSG